ncbi:metallophosphoesterase 1-like [Eurytemora carolleeae]|uniref:metallophosphoesterase 1-like n=1 Tax=Eurytemora carolleeae TaxID=1294199 RepID=UPI000C75E132|nr:metallophosphoesterase 1-like [Eurytemora carolleeae]|eukprot:XP_023329968.1 metallophosphoesterase 1-like [Eurytemora affinis]
MLTMRSPKQLLKGFLVLTALSLFYNEFFIYYVTLYSCSYPGKAGEKEETLNALILADTHLLGSRNGHWFDKLRREWQMHRTFQTAMSYFRPEAVFFLGDIFDEGKWCPPEEFKKYRQRFDDLFYTGADTKVYVVAGNHDIGFHYSITPYLDKRFKDAFKTRSVQQIKLKGVDFVLINSMAFENDGCFLCKDAEKLLEKISSNLSCTEDECPGPVLMSHFPLYRESDELCDELDSAPGIDKMEKFRERWECISNSSSNLIKQKLKPRIAFTGHTHHGCRTDHDSFIEWTVSSFSWRNKQNPAFLLARFSAGSKSVSKCMMPEETTVYYMYIGFATILLLYCIKLRYN